MNLRFHLGRSGSGRLHRFLCLLGRGRGGLGCGHVLVHSLPHGRFDLGSGGGEGRALPCHSRAPEHRQHIDL